MAQQDSSAQEAAAIAQEELKTVTAALENKSKLLEDNKKALQDAQVGTSVNCPTPLLHFRTPEQQDVQRVLGAWQ